MTNTNVMNKDTNTGKHQHRKNRKGSLFFKKFSPFIFLAVALIIFFPFIIIDSIKRDMIRAILLPFIIANTVYADFVLHKYFENGKRLFVWIAEGIITALIIYWML